MSDQSPQFLESNQQKCGSIALIGAPNSGKSTLTNQLVGQKISIVSPKIQTTRNALRAIMIEGSAQLVFIDTPGIFLPKKERPLERIIVKSAWQAVREADRVCMLIDASAGFTTQDRHIINDLKKLEIKPLILINKIDLVKKTRMLPIMAECAALGLEDIFPISALDGEGVERLKNQLLQDCPVAPWTYDGDDISDAPMKFIASEITREKLFLNLYEDLPYSLCVKNEAWEVFDNGQVKIHQTIYVLKESQKMIILGKNGAMIREIGKAARADIAELVGKKVHLFLFVKVKKDWMNDRESYEY